VILVVVIEESNVSGTWKRIGGFLNWAIKVVRKASSRNEIALDFHLLVQANFAASWSSAVLRDAERRSACISRFRSI
jgi:hypothetical protein